jgi:MarR family transcriptional regulator, organic hydroperoxide resistance regulator
MEPADTHRQRRDREASLLELLARANHLLAEALEARPARDGISATDGRVLAALLAAEGTTMTKLADRLRLKQPTLTKAIDRMERAHLVRRQRPSEDRRRTLLHLTERGRRIAAPLAARARQHEHALSRALGAGNSRALHAALDRLVGELEALHGAARPPRRRRAGAAADSDGGSAL